MSGTRTAYFASDPSVAIAEFARQRPLGAPAQTRCLYSFRLHAVSLLDLRTAAVVRRLGLTPGPGLFLDRQIGRRVSRDVRERGLCQGLIVPSMAFLDQPDRFNVVLFSEHLHVDLERILTDRDVMGEISLAGRH